MYIVSMFVSVCIPIGLTLTQARSQGLIHHIHNHKHNKLGPPRRSLPIPYSILETIITRPLNHTMLLFHWPSDVLIILVNKQSSRKLAIISQNRQPLKPINKKTTYSSQCLPLTSSNNNHPSSSLMRKLEVSSTLPMHHHLPLRHQSSHQNQPFPAIIRQS